MKKFLLAVTLATFALMAAMTGVKAAPVSTGNLAQSAAQTSTINGLTKVHSRRRDPFALGPGHACRHHGFCGGGFGIGPGGIYIGPGIYNYHGTHTRSCRRVRRSCRREWGGGRRYRRCVRRRDCRP